MRHLDIPKGFSVNKEYFVRKNFLCLGEQQKQGAQFVVSGRAGLARKLFDQRFIVEKDALIKYGIKPIEEKPIVEDEIVIPEKPIKRSHHKKKVEKEYHIIHKGGPWHDVVDDDGNKVNERGMNRKQAENYVVDLLRKS